MSKYIELLVRMDEEGKTSKESKIAKILAEKALDREDYVDAYLMGFNSTELLSGGTTELSRQGLFEELSKKTDNHKAKNKQKRTEVQNRINHYFGVERVEKKKDPSTISLILGDVTPVVQYNWYLDNGGRYEWLENDYTPTSKYQTEFDFIEKYGSGKKFKAGRTDKEIRAIRTSFNRNRNDWVKWDIYHGVPKEETFKKRKVREVTYDTILDDCKAEFHNMTLLYAGSINMKQIIKYKLGMTEAVYKSWIKTHG